MGIATRRSRCSGGDGRRWLERNLLDLSRRLDDRELIEAVFQALHPSTGFAAMFGFDALAAFNRDA
jgi:two-component system chemotaxis sensor kinase CheA